MLFRTDIKIKIDRTVILPVVLYGCEIWSLRRIFGPKRDEVTGEWGKLHNKELYAVYSSPNTRVIKSRSLRWARHVARMERDANRVLVGKPEGRIPLEIPRRRWEDNIKINFREVGWGAWTGSILLRIWTGGGLL